MLPVVPSEVESKRDCVLRSVKEEIVELDNNSKQEFPSLRLTLTSSISHVPERAELELPPSKKLKARVTLGKILGKQQPGSGSTLSLNDRVKNEVNISYCFQTSS